MACNIRTETLILWIIVLSGGRFLTPQMHAELAALSRLFYSEEISEDEWALLQIHLAYCNDCHRVFVESQQASKAAASESSAGSN